MKVSSKFSESKQQLTITVKGDLLSTNAAERTEEISTLLDQHKDHQTVKLDLSAAKMIDSMGLNALLGIVRRLREDGSHIVIRITSSSVNRVLEFSHFNRLAEIDYREKE